MLTAGEPYERFKAQLEIAAQNGCKGFLAGRALWQEAAKLKGEDKEQFIDGIMPARFKELVDICLA